MKWHEKLADELGSNHSDTQAVVRAGKNAKRRSNRRVRRLNRSQSRQHDTED